MCVCVCAYLEKWKVVRVLKQFNSYGFKTTLAFMDSLSFRGSCPLVDRQIINDLIYQMGLKAKEKHAG